MKTSNLFMFVAGLMVGLVIASVWHLENYLPATTQTKWWPASGQQSSSTTSQLPPQSGAVAVRDQPAGNSVLIESVTVPPPGVWIAVEEVGEDGTLGNVLGAERVRQPASNVAVSLLRPTLAGQRYAVVLYRDDGNGTFDLASDSAYVDFDTGARVEELFSVQ